MLTSQAATVVRKGGFVGSRKVRFVVGGRLQLPRAIVPSLLLGRRDEQLAERIAASLAARARGRPDGGESIALVSRTATTAARPVRRIGYRSCPPIPMMRPKWTASGRRRDQWLPSASSATASCSTTPRRSCQTSTPSSPRAASRVSVAARRSSASSPVRPCASTSRPARSTPSAKTRAMSKTVATIAVRHWPFCLRRSFRLPDNAGRRRCPARCHASPSARRASDQCRCSVTSSRDWRRLVRDYEQRLDVSEAMIHIALGSLLLRRIAN
jgi:hypothetical protein